MNEYGYLVEYADRRRLKYLLSQINRRDARWNNSFIKRWMWDLNFCGGGMTLHTLVY